MKTTFLILITIFTVNLNFAQTGSYKPTKLTSAPNLSVAQMQEDLNNLQNNIAKAAPHSILNKHLKGISLASYFEQYRKTITTKTTPQAFAIMVGNLLNLVQDGHANLVLSPKSVAYVRKSVARNKLAFDTLAFKQAAYYNVAFKQRKTDFSLPVKYIEGKYLVTIPFKYKGVRYAAGSELIECNGQTITRLLPSLITDISPLRWDVQNKVYYKDNFYKAQNLVAKGKISLGFKNKAGQLIKQSFNYTDKVDLLKKPARKIGYFTQPEAKVLFLDKEKVLYIRMPRMDGKMVKFYTSKIDSIYALGKKPGKVIFDIRGNGGGSDNCYLGALEHLITKPLDRSFKLSFPKDPFVLNYFGLKGNKGISTQNSTLLGSTPFYVYSKTQFAKPAANSVKYNGKIFVLQDEFIYSSAGNLSTMAKANSNIITIGNRTGLCGGKQARPIYFSLPHSKLIYRLEPMLDFSNIAKTEDIFHDEVSQYIPQTFDDYQKRLFSKNDIYSPVFLRKHDPLFKAVVNYK